jgi:taurine--2-oxoglutarate transaminase
MLAGIELVRDRTTREPLSPQRTEDPVTPAMAAVRHTLNERHVSTLTRWNLIVLAPPLTIAEEELDAGLEAVEAALATADTQVTAAAL